MLDGNIQIRQDLGFLCDGIDQLIGDLIGIEIVQTDPLEIELAQFTQQLCQLMLAVEVRAVTGDILCNHQQFLHACRSQFGSLVQNLIHGAAAILAAQRRNHTVSAMVVTALGNAQIGIPGRGRQNAGAALLCRMDITHMAGTQPLFHYLINGGGNIAVAAGTQNAVHFRQFIQHIVLIALCHTAGHQNLLDLACLLQFCHLQNIVDGLLTGRGQEAAGVDHHNVCSFRSANHSMACSLCSCHHLLTVHLVLGTTQGNKCNMITQIDFSLY